MPDLPTNSKDSQDEGCLPRIVQELYDVLAYVRPLIWSIAEGGGEPPWRKARAKKSIGRIDAVMISADSLLNDHHE
jgi:hypothetical protein